jgi:hypothetical protein
MSGDAYVHTEAVQRIEKAFARFSSSVLGALPGPLWRAESASSMLVDRQGRLRARVSELEAAAAEAESEEDGDGSAYRAAAAEAREEIAHLRALGQALASARAEYQRESRALQQMGEENASQARQFLSGVQEDLQAYLAKELEPGGTGGSIGINSAVATPLIGGDVESLSPTRASAPEPARFPLPSGFSWLSLDQIESTDDLTWQKISNEEMKQGFQRLQTDVLTTFQMFGTSAGRDWFRTEDQVKGRTYENGAERVFDAFFGDEPIAISRTHDGALFSITNGRHRIATARELGWSAVPIIFTDQRRQ